MLKQNILTKGEIMKKKEERQNFVFFKNWVETINTLPEEYQLETYKSLCEYGLSGVMPSEVSAVVKAILQSFSVAMDNAISRHKVLIENAKKGGNPNFKICDHRRIRQALDNLIDKYNKDKKKFKGLPDVIKFGAFLHNEVQHIHPFVDGNSRLTRLVLEHFCYQNRLPNYEIPMAYISRYTQLTKGAKKRDDNKLFELLKEIFLFLINAPGSIFASVSI